MRKIAIFSGVAFLVIAAFTAGMIVGAAHLDSVIQDNSEMWRNTAAWEECGVAINDDDGSYAVSLALSRGTYTTKGVHIFRNGKRYCRGGVIP